MATDAERYDGALLGILQSEGKVAPFLDVVLGFLYRRTDFFRLMKKDTDNLGFPPGVAFKLLVNIFRKYEALATQDQNRIDELKKARNTQPKSTLAIKEPNIQKADTTETSENPAQLGARSHTTPPVLSNLAEGQSSSEIVTSSAQHQDSKIETETNHVIAEAGRRKKGHEQVNTREDNEDMEDPDLARERRELQANPLTYNGADCGDYFWSQTISEADIRVKVPETIVKGKQVKVDVKKNTIAVSCLQGTEWIKLVNGELEWEIKSEESMWTLSPGEFVHINVEKKQERWWERVFVGEVGINTRKIDCSRPMTDLDDEAQAKIEEMMYNQRQKQLGLPQSHEVKTHEMLRKAWDAEGSPFKGQPFDPSKFSVDSSGVANFSPGN